VQCDQRLLPQPISDQHLLFAHARKRRRPFPKQLQLRQSGKGNFKRSKFDYSDQYRAEPVDHFRYRRHGNECRGFRGVGQLRRGSPIDPNHVFDQRHFHSSSRRGSIRRPEHYRQWRSQSANRSTRWNGNIELGELSSKATLEGKGAINRKTTNCYGMAVTGRKNHLRATALASPYRDRPRRKAGWAQLPYLDP
jgi:hypothetical protein